MHTGETYRVRKGYNGPLPLQNIFWAEVGLKGLPLHHVRWDPPATGTGTPSVEFEIRIRLQQYIPLLLRLLLLLSRSSS